LPRTSGIFEIAKRLLAAGADANMTYETGISGPRIPLLNALANPDMVKVLIRGGSDVNYRKDTRSRPAEYTGHTVLMIAASKGYLDTVKLLVEAGADVNAENPAGETAAVLALKERTYCHSSISCP